MRMLSPLLLTICGLMLTNPPLGLAEDGGNPGCPRFTLAVRGEGFINLTRPNGAPGYTKRITVRIRRAGQLTSRRGYLVSPGITIPFSTKPIRLRILPEGTVEARGLPGPALTLGELGGARFENPAALRDTGAGYLRETEESGASMQSRFSEDGLGSLVMKPRRITCIRR